MAFKVFMYVDVKVNQLALTSCSCSGDLFWLLLWKVLLGEKEEEENEKWAGQGCL